MEYNTFYITYNYSTSKVCLNLQASKDKNSTLDEKKGAAWQRQITKHQYQFAISIYRFHYDTDLLVEKRKKHFTFMVVKNSINSIKKKCTAKPFFSAEVSDLCNVITKLTS